MCSLCVLKGPGLLSWMNLNMSRFNTCDYDVWESNGLSSGSCPRFRKKGQFQAFINFTWKQDMVHDKGKYIDCAYLFSAAKFSRTVSANAELVSRQTQLIRVSAILKGTDRIHYRLIKRTLIKHAITVGGRLHAS